MQNAIKKPETVDVVRRSVLGIIITSPAACAPFYVPEIGKLSAANTNGPPERPLPPTQAARAIAMETWPVEEPTQEALRRTFGDPRDSGSLVKVPTPWRMRLAWDVSQHRDFVWAHEKVSASLRKVFRGLSNVYSKTDARHLGLDLFGGDHVDRKMRGADRWSLHAWGIAFDFDPLSNRYSWDHRRARFARPAYDDWWAIWEAEGWYSLGRHHDYDWMHIQAAWRR